MTKAAALASVVALMQSGATPACVAQFVVNSFDTHGIKIGVFLSHSIEDAAFPGTFAEAVFNILAGE